MQENKEKAIPLGSSKITTFWKITIPKPVRKFMGYENMKEEMYAFFYGFKKSKTIVIEILDLSSIKKILEEASYNE